jgi:dihydrofolate reductase
MRKLKLQAQISLDGYVASPEGQLDWMTWEHDKKILDFINHLTDTSDTILMGRKMSPEFLNYWENIVDNQPDSPEFSFANKMVDTRKIIFSKTTNTTQGRNATVENGDLVEKVNQLKNQEGKDIVVYGGANFVSSLIHHNLIDDYYLFVHPIAIGKGLNIFQDRKPLKLIDSTAYEYGVVVNHFQSRDAK